MPRLVAVELLDALGDAAKAATRVNSSDEARLGLTRVLMQGIERGDKTNGAAPWQGNWVGGEGSWVYMGRPATAHSATRRDRTLESSRAPMTSAARPQTEVAARSNDGAGAPANGARSGAGSSLSETNGATSAAGNVSAAGGKIASSGEAAIVPP